MNEVGQIDHLLRENSDLRMERRKLKRKYERLHDALEELVAELSGSFGHPVLGKAEQIINDALNTDMIDTVEQ